MTAGPATARRPAPFDWLLLFAILVLSAGGAVMVYSASAITATRNLHDEFYFLTRQVVAFAIGTGLLVLALRLGYRRLIPLAYPLLVRHPGPAGAGAHPRRRAGRRGAPAAGSRSASSTSSPPSWPRWRWSSTWPARWPASATR